jgi:hypothetical protein
MVITIFTIPSYSTSVATVPVQIQITLHRQCNLALFFVFCFFYFYSSTLARYGSVLIFFDIMKGPEQKGTIITTVPGTYIHVHTYIHTSRHTCHVCI